MNPIDWDQAEKNTHEATIRIPTDTYAYIEVKTKGMPEEIIALYRRFSELWQGGKGLAEPEFQRILDEYLWGSGSMDSEEYVGMNLEQQNIIQTIKKSRNRHNYKLRK